MRIVGGADRLHKGRTDLRPSDQQQRTDRVERCLPELTRHERRVHHRACRAIRLRHPVVGDLTADCETFTPAGDPDATLHVYTAEPGSPSQRALNLLGSWDFADGSSTPPAAG
ncbi:hypothetical protein [Amycolatopsis sp. NPDC001319]|uniref:MmyB family transcriptional regulator n=1 Tax=unclassified Amycolatopsis TaxID=2618356 RepID=UPI0036A3B630